MPLAGDAYLQQGGQLPAGNNPLNRLQLGSFSTTIDPAQIIAQWTQFVEQYLFPIIEDLTGVDLSAFLPILDGTVGALTTLFGDLNPLSGTFNPLDAVTTFIELMVSVGANLPMALIEELVGFSGGVPILSQLIGLFTGTTGGLTGLSGLGSIFGDLTGLLGNPTALGSGTPALPGISSIPILGGLLSGGNLLGSIIPGLDASKIISGNFPISMITGLAAALTETASGVIDALVNVLTGGSGSGFDISDLTSGFTDLLGLFGNPTGLGSGSPSLPGIGSIPLLGGLLSGGSILGSIIPGLDASKIVTGAFPVSMITNLSTLLTGFGTGSSIISQLLGAVPNLASGTTGLTGLTDVFTDLFGLLGSPTNVGSTGTVTLPSITSIPILGGLLSGGSILGSIIPGLDASKITTGSFNISQITSLSTMLGGLGTGSSILTQLIGAIPHGGSPTGLTGFGSIFTDLFGLLGNPTSVGTGSPAVSSTARLPILGGLLDGLFQGFTQATGVPADQSNVADAAAGVSDSLAGVSAVNAQILAALGSGTPDSDDFERSVSATGGTGGWGANWLTMLGSGGNASVNGHDAVFKQDLLDDDEMVARKTDVQAATDNQSVSVVLASGNGAITDGNPAVDLWLRMTSFTTYATRTGLRMRFSGDKTLKLSWFNSGTETSLATGSHSISMNSGATLTFEAGQGLTARRFVAKVNNTPVLDFTEGGTTSQFGTSNRYRGAGLRGEYALLMFPPIPIYPATFKQWTATG